MKQSIRFFSIGLLSASIVLLGFYFLFDGSKASSKDVPLEEMIEEIEASGHRVVTEKEFIAYTINSDKEVASDQDSDKKEEKSSDKKDNKKKDDKKDDKKDKKKDKKDKKDKKEDEVIKAKIKTDSGVVSQDIAEKLVNEKIIDDGDKFAKYLDDNDYSAYIQIGTFKVNSDMSDKELAKVFTTYPGD